MSKKNKKKLSPYQQKKLAELEEQENSKKKYKNPTNSVVGKIIIFTLAILMLGSGLFALIYAIVNYVK